MVIALPLLCLSGLWWGFQVPLDQAFATPEPAPFAQPVLSPDGHSLVYAVRTPTERSLAQPFHETGMPATAVGSRLMLASLHGGEPRRLGPAGANASKPSWSPDGRWIAFICDGDGVARLWLYDRMTDSSQPLAATPMKPLLWTWDRPWWSPDGQWIYVQAQLATEAAQTRDSPQATSTEVPTGKPLVEVHVSGQSAPVDAPVASSEQQVNDHLRRLTHTRLVRIARESGAVDVLVDEAGMASVLRLSPTGHWLSYLSVTRLDEARGQPVHDLAVMPATGGAPQTIARGLPRPALDYFGHTYRWHPDGKRLFFVQDGRLMQVVVSEAGRHDKPVPLTSNSVQLTPWPLAFSRDGTHLVVGAEPIDDHDYRGPQPSQLLRIQLSDGAMAQIPLPADLQYQSLVTADWYHLWQPSGNGLTVQGLDQGRTVFMRWQNGAWRQLARHAARIHPVCATPDHQRLVVRLQDLNHPPDWCTLDTQAARVEQVSRITPALNRLPPWRVHRLPVDLASDAGQTKRVETVVLTPASEPSQPLPAIVLHYGGADLTGHALDFGGGATATFPNWIFAGRGYALVLTHVPMGPEGEASNPLQAYAAALVPQVDAAVAAGLIDADRIGLLGHSYGGYGTAAVLTQSDRFAAGVAISGVYDLAASYAESPSEHWYEHGQGRMGDHPWAETQRYLDNSPFYQADKIQTPLLLIHGDRDQSIADVRRFYRALERLSKPAQLAVYPGQGHGLGAWQAASARDACQRILDFFATHLQPHPEP